MEMSSIAKEHNWYLSERRNINEHLVFWVFFGQCRYFTLICGILNKMSKILSQDVAISLKTYLSVNRIWHREPLDMGIVCHNWYIGWLKIVEPAYEWPCTSHIPINWKVFDLCPLDICMNCCNLKNSQNEI